MAADGVEFELHKPGHARRRARRRRPPAASSRSSRRCASSATSCPTRSRPAPSCTSSSRRSPPRSTPASSSASTGTCGPTPSPPGLAAALRRMGVEIVEGAEVVDFERSGRRVTGVRTAAGDYAGRRARARRRGVDAAARADARRLAADAGRQGLQLLRHADRRAAPLGAPGRRPRRLHAARRADADRRDDGVQRAQHAGSTTGASTAIVGGARASFLPWRRREIDSHWAGMRPITAGRAARARPRRRATSNVYLATGYSMQGVTLAPPGRPGARRAGRDRQAPGGARAVRLRAAAARMPLPRRAEATGVAERGAAARRDHRLRQHRHAT